MNKYQIQVEHKTENKWDWICVYANSDQEAIQNAKIRLYDFQNPVYSQTDDYDTKYWKDHYKEKFQGYIISSYSPIFSVERDCEPPKDYDTIPSLTLAKTKSGCKPSNNEGCSRFPLGNDCAIFLLLLFWYFLLCSAWLILR